MDPDKALAELRRLASQYGDDAPPIEEVDDLALRMVEAFQGLDTWIINGGFLPTDWQGPDQGWTPDDLDGG